MTLIIWKLNFSKTPMRYEFSSATLTIQKPKRGKTREVSYKFHIHNAVDRCNGLGTDHPGNARSHFAVERHTSK